MKLTVHIRHNGEVLSIKTPCESCVEAKKYAESQTDFGGPGFSKASKVWYSVRA